NVRVVGDGEFENMWVQPAAGDAGGAVGAALAAVHLYEGHPRRPNGGDRMHGSLLGPSFSQLDIERRLTAAGAHFSVTGEDDMVEQAADALAKQQAVGWVHGLLADGPSG